MEGIKLEINVSEEMLNTIAQKVIELQPKEEPTSQDIYYTVKEAADYLSVGSETIRRHIQKGLLKAKKPGKSYIITQKNLDEYVKTN